MSGIGQAMRTERERQGRTLADAAAETRVRESYLDAIEEEQFDVLGGDVYARGFIRLYGRYLGLDADDLVQAFRTHHERPAEVTAIPGAAVDEVLQPMRGLPRLALSAPVVAGVGIVVVLVLLFVLVSGGGDEPEEIDPNAPGPSPAASVETGPTTAATAPSTAADAGAASAVVPAPTGDAPVDGAAAATGEALTEVTIVVTALQPVRLSVEQGQPPVSDAQLDPGESRTLIDPSGQQVVFTISDFSAAEITVNGDPLQSEQLAGRAVRISCTVGESACDASPL
jgi:cytoskeleton protein RodZ